jgi:hypothetical protein
MGGWKPGMGRDWRVARAFSAGGRGQCWEGNARDLDTFFQITKFDCSRQGVVRAVARDVGSEGSTGTKSDCEIFVCNIRWEICDV